MQKDEQQVTYELEGCQALAWAVLARAVRDIQRGDRWQQESAVRFVQGDVATRWCELLDVEVDLLRDAVQPGGVLYANISPRGEAV